MEGPPKIEYKQTNVDACHIDSMTTWRKWLFQVIFEKKNTKTALSTHP